MRRDTISDIYLLGAGHFVANGCARGLSGLREAASAQGRLGSLIEEDMRRVKKWKDSEHFQRWLATYCLASEKKMRKIRGYRNLPGLWILLRKLTEQNLVDTTHVIDEVA